MRIINHQLFEKNIIKPDWEVKHLFIGTFNPQGGQPVNYYYGRESNYFWKILSKIFKDDFDPYSCNNIEDFYIKLRYHKIACIDIINSLEFDETQINIEDVTGNGYSDSKIINNKIIRNYNTDLISNIIQNNPSIKFYSTWGKGSKLSNWKNEIEKLPKRRVNLVSPSRVARVPQGNNKFEYILNDYSTKIIP
jgi:hypothetical protein